MLYPVLHWMEKENLIESEWREAETGSQEVLPAAPGGPEGAAHRKKTVMAVHTTLTKLWKIKPRLT